MMTGRFAPSPSGDLHIGNLRTALLAWLFARSTGREFLIRMEDLDGRTRPGSAERQLADLAAIGLDWSEPVVVQSERRELYREVVDGLVADGSTFECFCTRREIQEAPTAPHAAPGAYPGTCRELTEVEREAKRLERPAALRLRAEVISFTVHDTLHGSYTGDVDDFVLVRGDGIPAYNLAVVVDDHAQGIDQVVRGDDLLSSAPRQAYLATRLGYAPPEYAHVPMVLNPDGVRLSKRDGAISLEDLAAQGQDAGIVVSLMAQSLGMTGTTAADLLDQFDPASLPREPWIFHAS